MPRLWRRYQRWTATVDLFGDAGFPQESIAVFSSPPTFENFIAMTDESTNISGPVFALCEALGLDPNNVFRLDISLDYVDAELFSVRDGSKYVHWDGDVATETRRFNTTTIPECP